MTFKELEKHKIRARYLQIDSKNKCVPSDWYLGFETFTIYSFF